MYESFFSIQATVAADVKFGVFSTRSKLHLFIIPTQVPYWYSFLIMMKLSLSVTI